MAGHLREIWQFLGDCFKLCFGIAVIVCSFAFYAKYIAYAQAVQPGAAEESSPLLVETVTGLPAVDAEDGH